MFTLSVTQVRVLNAKLWLVFPRRLTHSIDDLKTDLSWRPINSVVSKDLKLGSAWTVCPGLDRKLLVWPVSSTAARSSCTMEGSRYQAAPARPMRSQSALRHTIDQQWQCAPVNPQRSIARPSKETRGILQLQNFAKKIDTSAARVKAGWNSGRLMADDCALPVGILPLVA
jgi:hypothetical protein